MCVYTHTSSCTHSFTDSFIHSFRPTECGSGTSVPPFPRRCSCRCGDRCTLSEILALGGTPGVECSERCCMPPPCVPLDDDSLKLPLLEVRACQLLPMCVHTPTAWVIVRETCARTHTSVVICWCWHGPELCSRCIRFSKCSNRAKDISTCFDSRVGQHQVRKRHTGRQTHVPLELLKGIIVTVVVIAYPPPVISTKAKAAVVFVVRGHCGVR